jgi:hypothetical protein
MELKNFNCTVGVAVIKKFASLTETVLHTRSPGWIIPIQNLGAADEPAGAALETSVYSEHDLAFFILAVEARRTDS